MELHPPHHPGVQSKKGVSRVYFRKCLFLKKCLFSKPTLLKRLLEDQGLYIHISYSHLHQNHTDKAATRREDIKLKRPYWYPQRFDTDSTIVRRILRIPLCLFGRVNGRPWRSRNLSPCDLELYIQLKNDVCSDFQCIFVNDDYGLWREGKDNWKCLPNKSTSYQVLRLLASLPLLLGWLPEPTKEGSFQPRALLRPLGRWTFVVDLFWWQDGEAQFREGTTIHGLLLGTRQLGT